MSTLKPTTSSGVHASMSQSPAAHDHAYDSPSKGSPKSCPTVEAAAISSEAIRVITTPPSTSAGAEGAACEKTLDESLAEPLYSSLADASLSLRDVAETVTSSTQSMLLMRESCATSRPAAAPPVTRAQQQVDDLYASTYTGTDEIAFNDSLLAQVLCNDYLACTPKLSGYLFSHSMQLATRELTRLSEGFYRDETFRPEDRAVAASMAAELKQCLELTQRLEQIYQSFCRDPKAVDISKVGATLGLIQQQILDQLAGLKPGERMLFPFGWSSESGEGAGHAMLIEIELASDGKLLLHVYNSQPENFHPRVGDPSEPRYECQLSWSLGEFTHGQENFAKILPDILELSALPRSLCPGSEEYIYSKILKSDLDFLGAKKITDTSIEPSPTWMRPQRADVCTWQSIQVWERARLQGSCYKAFKFLVQLNVLVQGRALVSKKAPHSFLEVILDFSLRKLYGKLMERNIKEREIAKVLQLTEDELSKLQLSIVGRQQSRDAIDEAHKASAPEVKAELLLPAFDRALASNDFETAFKAWDALPDPYKTKEIFTTLIQKIANLSSELLEENFFTLLVAIQGCTTAKQEILWKITYEQYFDLGSYNEALRSWVYLNREDRNLNRFTPLIQALETHRAPSPDWHYLKERPLDCSRLIETAKQIYQAKERVQGLTLVLDLTLRLGNEEAARQARQEISKLRS